MSAPYLPMRGGLGGVVARAVNRPRRHQSLDPPARRPVTTKAEKGNVFFEPLLTVISPQGEATLNAIVRKAKKQGVRTVVLGFVQETSTTSNDDSLSTQRARAVAAYLRDRGLKGAYSIRGNGVAGTGDAARRVNVNVTYQSGC
jgi:outer membrane protein OmpA-like peptidoglycan-associated protein